MSRAVRGDVSSTEGKSAVEPFHTIHLTSRNGTPMESVKAIVSSEVSAVFKSCRNWMQLNWKSTHYRLCSRLSRVRCHHTLEMGNGKDNEKRDLCLAADRDFYSGRLSAAVDKSAILQPNCDYHQSFATSSTNR